MVLFYRRRRDRISRSHVGDQVIIAVGPNGDFANRELFAEFEQARFRQLMLPHLDAAVYHLYANIIHATDY